MQLISFTAAISSLSRVSFECLHCVRCHKFPLKLSITLQKVLIKIPPGARAWAMFGASLHRVKFTLELKLDFILTQAYKRRRKISKFYLLCMIMMMKQRKVEHAYRRCIAKCEIRDDNNFFSLSIFLHSCLVYMCVTPLWCLLTSCKSW